MAGIFPALYSDASARCPRPGRAAAKVGSIAKRRRHASSRASGLATNSSNGIGRLRVHNPPGERKSGMPHSVEMPAPVKGTIMDASAIMSPSCSTPLRRSVAITGIIRKSGRAGYSTAARIAPSMSGSWNRACVRRWCSGRLGDRFLRLVGLLVVALPDLGDRRRHRLRFSRRFAVLGQLFQFGLELGLSCRDLFRQFFSCGVVQACEFLDAQRFQIDLCHAGLPFAFGYREGAQATSTTPILSTANACANRTITILQRPVPIRAPIPSANGAWDKIQEKGWA